LGISIEIPQSWDGVIYAPTEVGAPEGDGAVLEAANFGLPKPPIQTGVPMQPGEVRIALFDEGSIPSACEPNLASAPKLSMTAQDFGTPIEGIAPSHAFGRKTFCVRGHMYDMWVDSATQPIPEPLLATINEALQSLRIERGD
jgi:hypothetical protein